MSAKSWPLAIVFGVVGGVASVWAGAEALMLAGAISQMMSMATAGSGGIGAVSFGLIGFLVPGPFVPMFLVYHASRVASPRPSRVLVRAYWVTTLILVLASVFGGFGNSIGLVPLAIPLVAVLLALQSIAGLWATLLLVRHYSS